jgi:hypothetical protein
VIEPTDEMCAAFFAADRAHRRSELERLGFHRAHLPTMDAGAFRAGLAAVLAIVERDLGTVGPCSSTLPDLFDGELGTWCELRHGHTGDHEAGPTRWRETASALRWTAEGEAGP